ncbi:sodium:neurotransmitter symporter family [Holotrichia oblita]|uniref:Sodium:neurotransmitter symporter family n=1 Tax=Holotrichia oblita TaxID=644536 RepID=A0ACB9TAN9_HOLOL|nr:sodium:neurotransmitter symporter family [Holotrichia oblita]
MYCSGSEVLMVLIPDVLFRFDIWQIPAGLWYLSIFFFAMLATLYSIIGLVDSITEKFSSLKKYTVAVCFILCVLGFSLSIWLTLNVSFIIIRDWRHGGLTVLTAAMSLLINLAIFFIYSTRKVIEDYIFTYGKPPEKYWIALWKAAPIFTIFAFIFALSFQSSGELTKEHNIWVISLSYLQCSTVLLPVVTIMIGRCCKNIKQRTLDYLTKPAPSWGPTNLARKLARAKFFPQRDIKCRNLTLKCKHKCAVSNNVKYMEEIAYQRKKYLLAKEEMEREMLAGSYEAQEP